MLRPTRIVAFLIALIAIAPAQAPAGGFVCLTCAKSSDAASRPAALRKTVLGQPLDSFEPWIAHIAGTKPVIVQTPRSTLVAAVEGGPAGPLSDAELAHLRSVFPALPAGTPPTLDAHQEAHVLAFRLVRIEEDLREMLDLDDSGRVKPESSPYSPLASDHVEIFALSKPNADFDLAHFLCDFPTEWHSYGVTLRSGPTAVVGMPALKDAKARAHFAFASSLQLLSALSRAGAGPKPWIQVGIAHLLADRHGQPNHATYILPLPGGAKHPENWDAFIAEIASRKPGDVAALAESPVHALSYISEIQSWSMVRWLIAKDAKKFAVLVRHLLHSSPSDSGPKTLLAAMRKTYALDLVTLLDEWKAWVQKPRASSTK